MTAGVTSATVPPTIRRRLPRDERARQLVEVADTVFSEHGVAAASMEDIAERAGITKPVLYDHFGSKDGLLAAVVLRAGEELAAATLAAVDSASGPEDALARGLRAYFRFIERRRASWLSLLAEAGVPGSAAAAALEQVRDGQAELIATLMSADVPDCDLPRARLYAQVVVGASERLVTRPGTEQPSVDVLTRHMMDVIWAGFGAVRTGQRWSE
ncbi:MAG TPA: TetR/AcrR family transcriptional regulator [Mycobacteriales bacterium]|jgi:AcrR family transcriptional regulator|nr:TetR/AcrR family transcriptional regulator [Mycobacteriales bacterium]